MRVCLNPWSHLIAVLSLWACSSTSFAVDLDYYSGLKKLVEGNPRDAVTETIISIREFPAHYQKDKNDPEKIKALVPNLDGETLPNALLTFLLEWESHTPELNYTPKEIVEIVRKNVEFRDQMRTLFPDVRHWQSEREKLVYRAPQMKGNVYVIKSETELGAPLTTTLKNISSTDPTAKRLAWAWVLGLPDGELALKGSPHEKNIDRLMGKAVLAADPESFLKEVLSGNYVAIKNHLGIVYVQVKEGFSEKKAFRELAIKEENGLFTCVARSMSVHQLIVIDP